MPVEDVQYLQEHGASESHVVYVDSARRDRSAYPTPAEYVVAFDEPFRNVTGVELLEANVPRTMYSIEQGRRDLYCDVGYSGLRVAEAGGAGTHVRLQARDHDMNTLRAALGAAFQDAARFGASLPRVAVGFPTDRPQYSSRFVFTCRVPFLFDFGRSNVAQEMGFDQFADRGLHQTEDGVNNYECFPHPTTRGLFASVNMGDKPLHEEARPEAAAEGTTPLTLPAERALVVTADPTADGEVFSHSVLSGITVPVVDAAALSTPTSPVALLEVLEPGDDGTTPLARVPLALGVEEEGGAPVLRAEGLDADPRHTCVLATGREYRLRLAPAPGGPALVGVAPAADGDGFACRVRTSFSTHRLVSPGIVALTGERVVILRIKEIEDHLHGSQAYAGATHAGMALLSIGNDTVALLRNRLDFTNLNYRCFHPIGKLSRVSLSFQTSDGRPYDFKNVNHYMLMVVKTLAPRARATLQRSLLNPDYDPDFMAYMAARGRRRGARSASSSASSSSPCSSDGGGLRAAERKFAAAESALLRLGFAPDAPESGSDTDSSGEDRLYDLG